MKTGSFVNTASSHVVTYCTAEPKGWYGSRVARGKLPTLKGAPCTVVARAEAAAQVSCVGHVKAIRYAQLVVKRRAEVNHSVSPIFFFSMTLPNWVSNHVWCRELTHGAQLSCALS